MSVQTVFKKTALIGIATLVLPSLLAAGLPVQNSPADADRNQNAGLNGPSFDATSAAANSAVAASIDAAPANWNLSRLPQIALAAKSLSVKFKAPVFTDNPSGRALSELHSPFSLKKGALLQVKTQAGDLVRGTDANSEEVWTPSWYATAQAGNITALSPVLLHSVHPQASVSLFPGSRLKWTAEGSTAALGEKPGEWLAVAEWQDWYGVLAEPKDWVGENGISQPILLWMNSKDVLPAKSKLQNIMDSRSSLSTLQSKILTETLLAAGSPASAVKQLLGEPQVAETSANLNGQDTSRPLAGGQTWRYERPDGQFTVSFSKDGKLAAWKWILPAAGDSSAAGGTFTGGTFTGSMNGNPKLNVTSSEDFHFSYDFNPLPLASTLQVSPLWQSQGDLGYTYLLGGNDRALLLKGDDGGYSGMFENSSLYALDRATGRKLWQINTGFGTTDAIMDAERQEVTVYSNYDKETSRYVAQIRRIRLSDGKVLWTCKLPEGQNAQIAAAGGIIAVGDLNEPSADPAMLTALDAKTGQVKWKKKLNDRDYLLLNQGSGDPYLLVQQGLSLNALEPETGEAAWNMQGYGEQPDNPDRDSYFAGVNRVDPLEEQAPARWILLGNRWYLMNMKSSTILAEYPAKAGERFEALKDPRYLLIERKAAPSADVNAAAESRTAQTETAYYDAVEQRELWKLPGAADHAVLDGSTVYLMLNGLPAAVSAASGQILWQAAAAGQDNGTVNPTQFPDSGYVVLGPLLLMEYGPDLLVLNKQDGSVKGRLQNVAAGYVDLREKIARSGLLNLNGDSVYAGSANGIFTRFDAHALKSQLAAAAK